METGCCPSRVVQRPPLAINMNTPTTFTSVVTTVIVNGVTHDHIQYLTVNPSGVICNHLCCCRQVPPTDDNPPQ